MFVKVNIIIPIITYDYFKIIVALTSAPLDQRDWIQAQYLANGKG